MPVKDSRIPALSSQLRRPKFLLLLLILFISLSILIPLLRLSKPLMAIAAVLFLLLILATAMTLIISITHAAIQYRAARRKLFADFHDRGPLSDNEFLAEFRLAPDAPLAELALRARDQLAFLSALPAQKIRPSDSFRSGLFDGIELLDITFRIEKETNCKIPLRQLVTHFQSIVPPKTDPTLRHFISALLLTPNLPLKEPPN